jgi:polyisoprenyl-teichoic acid--peptidoglycan teichoic acid transferase
MNKLNALRNTKIGPLYLGQVIFWAAALAVAVGGFFFVRGLVTCLNFPTLSLPGTPPSTCGTVTGGIAGPILNEQGTPVATSIAPPPPEASIPDSNLPPAWDGASRITVLIIGLDYRDWLAAEGPPRSDTMILLTIDPLTKTAGMLSIPRDMWVNIPGFGYSRINTAYFSGEGSKLPGGGPELARKTVEQFLGVPIQYYAQIDFGTFVQFIDLIGGIDVYNDEELRLDPVGSGKDKIRLTCCGMRHLTGEKTLAYARFRKGKDGDVGRANRQQKVILGIRNVVLDPQNFPVLLGKAQQFYEEFSSGIKTNLPFDTALRLGVLAREIPVESIKQGVIDYTMVSLDSVSLGGQNADVMKPLPDKIRILRDQIFTTSGPTSPLAAQGDPTALMKADGARVRLLNGSFSPGLDVKTGNYFLLQGMAVTQIGAADQAYDRTVIVLHGPKLYTLKYLQAIFGISSSTQVLIRPDSASPFDVEVYLGNDWANSNAIP